MKVEKNNRFGFTIEASAKRKWLVLSLMAVVIPMGLLVGFRLTGIIPEPRVPEIITVGAVTWSIGRSSSSIGFVGMKVRNHYNDDVASVGLEVQITTCTENSIQFGDCLWFGVNATATVQQGFIHSIRIRFSQPDENAFLLVSQQTEWLTIENLRITSFITQATYNREAHVYAIGVNNPKTCILRNPTYWYFLDIKENNLDHWTTVTLETTYFNGTTYRKAITPIQIGVIRDAGNTIDDPNVRLIEPGTYKAFVGVGIPPPGFDDENDYYKIWIGKDHVINITMEPGNNDFDLYLYDPTQEEVAGSENEGDALETIRHVTTSGGYWYIRVKAVAGSGIYTLGIEISQP